MPGSDISIQRRLFFSLGSAVKSILDLESWFMARVKVQGLVTDGKRSYNTDSGLGLFTRVAGRSRSQFLFSSVLGD